MCEWLHAINKKNVIQESLVTKKTEKVQEWAVRRAHIPAKIQAGHQ
jgi:hypothetical protein